MPNNFDRKKGPEAAKRMACLKALADENRLAIMGLLNRGELCVCEIWKSLDLPQNLVSHHLAVLKKSGLVMARKDGLKVYYSTDANCMKKLQSLLSPIFKTYAG